jgi:hypothetical protein
LDLKVFNIPKNCEESVKRRENAAGLDSPDHLFHLGPGLQEAAEMNRKPDGGTHPAKEDHLVGFAQGPREPSVQTDLQEPTVDVERIETMLNGEKFRYHGLNLTVTKRWLRRAHC